MMAATTMMIPTRQTATHIFYQAHLNGQLIKLIKDKVTDELFFDADSLSIALGYPDGETMLADKHAVEAIQACALIQGEQSFCRIDANGNPVLL